MIFYLNNFGLHNNALDWFNSHINSKSQYTFISGEQFTPGEVVAGVPQGFCSGSNTILNLHK